MQHYDFVVIGSGPAGPKGAIQAAKLGKRVALIERHTVIGGACLHTGTIPSKTLREAALYLSGWHQRGFYGRSYRVKERITAEDLMQRVDITTRHEVEVIQHQLHRNRVETLIGSAAFLDPHRVEITTRDQKRSVISGDRFLIATGSRPVQPRGIPFDAVNVVDSDHILQMKEIPRTLVVVGAGVVGVEYASIFSALDIKVTLIDGRNEMLGFLDREIVADFMHHLRDRGVSIRMGETVEAVETIDERNVRVRLASGKQAVADMALFAAGRVSNTEGLNLKSAGLTPDERGRLAVDEHYRTSVPHIYAAGDVIGFPALASVSMEQGRHAACHALGSPVPNTEKTSPYGIYAVPEISVIGMTEDDARTRNVPYEIGTARFRETSRGQILGLREGLLKLLFHLETRRLIGAHIVGEGASELIHIGQSVLVLGGTLEYFVSTVFNYPTLAEAYKIAALDAWNRFPSQAPKRRGRAKAETADVAAS
jgi:NAD(P) transhydrogenase